MNVLKKQAFVEAGKKHPNQKSALDNLYKTLKRISPATPVEMRVIVGSLDNFKYEANWYVIDVGGNHLRLITYISFERQRLMVKEILTHTEYDTFTNNYRSKS